MHSDIRSRWNLRIENLCVQSGNNLMQTFGNSQLMISRIFILHLNCHNFIHVVVIAVRKYHWKSEGSSMLLANTQLGVKHTLQFWIANKKTKTCGTQNLRELNTIRLISRSICRFDHCTNKASNTPKNQFRQKFEPIT